MIKTLQRKFVFTAMIAISILLLFLLGAINTVNILTVERQADRKLSMLAENEEKPDNNPMPHGNKPPREPFGQKDEDDDFMSSNFFVVEFNADGEITRTDVSRVSSVEEQVAETMAQELLQKNSLSGEIGRFRYVLRERRMGSGTVAVFLDTSGERNSCVRILLLSVAIGFICWLMMLLLTILLSKRAIRPIAENMEKQKQFVTNAGHEIKTPLAIIQSNTEAMELYNGENKWSRNIKAQTARLDMLTKNLLTLARMEENSANLKIADFSLSGLLTDCTAAFAESLSLRNIRMETHIQPEVSFRANREHIAQLVSVLMDNATKYTNTDGLLVVSLEKSDKHIRIQLKNTCDPLPTVPPDQLFDRFYRADAARTQKTGGYGIGLSVAQSITQAYNGKIFAEYENGDTVIFTVCFPC